MEFFPVLARAKDGSFVVKGLGDESNPSDIVLKLEGVDLSRVNHDLGSSIGSKGSYEYFKVISNSGERNYASLEVPTLQESKHQSWYSLEKETIIPDRILMYGPGFAFVVMPWTLGAGLGGVLVFGLIFRRDRTLE
jgi:hypothetical protein